MIQSRIKICGITSPHDAKAASDAGADAIGIVFYPPSPRYVGDLAFAYDIAQAAGPFVSVVGLFVDPEPQQLEQTLRAVSLNLLQFHGRESAGFCESFDRPYIKALRMKPDADISQQAQQYRSSRGILLDAYRKGVPGGTGETFDWQRIPANLPKPLILAGGLKPENVATAVSQVKPWAVDVSGGVEASPGCKSVEAMQAFVQAARKAN